ncbi:unnamed protein product [marine sediment metagenome]|uniref:Alkyl hydroperoxide reductase subunit C/ Thiol specific antioxidant domain-containing protein n=1 Tax=marine sediment metagenome TaxID=412755 RepID=X0ZR60_9ZZZZ
MPYLQSYHEKYGDRIAVVLVSVDWGGHKSFEPYREEHDITFPVLHDSTRKVKARLGAFSLPKLFLVDGKGVIREIMIGFDPEEAHKFEGRIDSLIGEEDQ